MAPDSPVTMRPSMKRKLSERDEILLKWRSDRNFQADADYREKCQTNLFDANVSVAKEVLIEQSHQSKISEKPVNKKLKTSSCADDALKQIIQECIGRIDKIDRDFEKYKKSSSFQRTSEIYPSEEKSCCKCTCTLKENTMKTKEEQKNITIDPDSRKDIKEIVTKHPEAVQVSSKNNGEDATVPAASTNIASQKSLVETGEILPHKELGNSLTSLSTDSSTENVSSESSKKIKYERSRINQNEDVFCNSPAVDDVSCNTPTANDEVSCNTPTANDEVSCNIPTAKYVVPCNTPIVEENVHCNTPTAKYVVPCNTPATKDGVSCTAPVSRDDSPCTTPVSNKIKADTRSKSKELWFEASIHSFDNSPNVQRGRPSIHILKDRRIVQSLAKQFS